MIDNIFVNRFKKMTDIELETIGFDADTYTDEARLTALEILQDRGISSERIRTTQQTLKTEQAKAIKEKILLNAPTHETDVKGQFSRAEGKTKALPQLYSKTFILVTSILFSTLFGSVLLMANFKKTGHPKARTQVLAFSLFYLFVPFILISLLNVDPNFALLANAVGGFILTDYFWNKHLGRSFKYTKQDWVKPVLIMLAISIPLSIILLKSGGAF